MRSFFDTLTLITISILGESAIFQTSNMIELQLNDKDYVPLDINLINIKNYDTSQSQKGGR